MSRVTLLLIIVLTLTAAFASDKKKKEEEAKELSENAQRLSDIRAPGAPPFSLRSSARIIQDGSEVQETYAETWVSPTQWRKETTHGDQREIILRNKGKEWIWRNMPDPYQHSDHVHVTSGGLHADDIRPLPWDLPPIEQIQDRTSAATHVRCIQTKAQVYSPSMSLCFVSETGFFAFRVDPTGNDLGSVRVCTFTNYQSFGNKTFPRTVTCLVDQKPVYQENVATLAPFQLSIPPCFNL